MSPASPVLERASPSQNAQQGVLIPPESRHAVSTFQAGVTVFKAVVGPGTLFLPSAVKNAGLVTALCVSLGAGVVSTWCMLLVLESADILRRKNRDIKTLGDIGFEVYGPMGQLVVDIAVVVSQLGFCTAYCVFVAENVQAIVFEAVGGMVGSDEKRKCSLSGFLASDMLVYYIILMCIPLLIPVTWLRQLKYFAVTNTLASLLVVVSVLFMLIALVKRYVEVGPEGGELELYNLHGTLVYVGVAMYAFEGVGVLLPVQESMAEPHRMPEVVCWTLSLACLLQVVFASLAYLNYRQHTASIVTISLADGHIMGGMGSVIAVQVAWVVEVLLTFPLQLFPAVRILERRCSVAERNSGMSWTKNLMRAGLVLLCMFISMFGYTSVDNLVALIGALGCVPLCIIYPALFHYKVKHGDVREFSCPEVANGSVESSLLRRESCGESGDLAIVALGGVGSALAAVLAVGSWMSADFHFQSCVMRP